MKRLLCIVALLLVSGCSFRSLRIENKELKTKLRWQQELISQSWTYLTPGQRVKTMLEINWPPHDLQMPEAVD